MSEEKPEFWSGHNPVIWGLGISFLLGCLVVFLGLQLGADGRTRYVEFLGSPPNAIGDTLAGIFAPLAFIWIVVTVFLQSHELSEQKKELSLTRDELKLAREAQEAQLKVMQKQADIFDDEKMRRDEDAERRYIDRLIKSFVETIRYSEVLSMEIHPVLREGNGEHYLKKWTLVPLGALDMGFEAAFLLYSRMIINSATVLTELEGIEPLHFRHNADIDGARRTVFLEEISKLKYFCQEATAARQRSSTIETILLSHLNLEKLHFALVSIDATMRAKFI
jgi:hypothetical protein